MEHNVFLLATDPNDPCRDVIHSRDTNLKVKVYCATEENFAPDTDEIQLYAYAGEKLYAFETISVTADDALDMINAIQWYADYIHHPEMEILPEDPRSDHSEAV